MSERTDRWRVELRGEAERAIARLPRPLRERVLTRLAELRGGLAGSDIRRLEGVPRGFRLRIGDFRAVLWVDDEARCIVVARFGPRGDVYKK